MEISLWVSAHLLSTLPHQYLFFSFLLFPFSPNFIPCIHEYYSCTVLTHAFRIELPLRFPVQLTLCLPLPASLFLLFSNELISVSLSLCLSLSLPASLKYPRPLPIPYAYVHPALLSIRSAHYAVFTCAHDRAQQRRQIRSSIERRNRTRASARAI